jgi:hypothetical protein
MISLRSDAECPSSSGMVKVRTVAPWRYRHRCPRVCACMAAIRRCAPTRPRCPAAVAGCRDGRPSLDQTKIASKKRLDGNERSVRRLAVLDLRTSQESLLTETRSVHDQVQWLDNSRVPPALSRLGSDAPTSDASSLHDGTGAAAVFVPEASSQAVVR